MATNALAKIRRRAKELVSKKGMKYQAALKKAGREYRGLKSKVSGTKRKARKAPVAVRVRQRAVGSVSTGGNLKTAYKHQLKEKLGWMMATMVTAGTKREKAAILKKIRPLVRELKALN